MQVNFNNSNSRSNINFEAIKVAYKAEKLIQERLNGEKSKIRRYNTWKNSFSKLNKVNVKIDAKGQYLNATIKSKEYSVVIKEHPFWNKILNRNTFDFFKTVKKYSVSVRDSEIYIRRFRKLLAKNQ